MKYETRCKQKEAQEERLKRDMEEYEANGGKVQQIEPGVIAMTPEKYGRVKVESNTNWKKD